ncbi:MAG: hypothetical protein NTW66_04575 [Candidatus Magasanikbacteria bacterium]|nr:hypothetical protein [Candidatus Magasanikbacteria bacterium]
MAQKNVGQGERSARDFGASSVKNENDIQPLIDELERNSETVARARESMKEQAANFSPSKLKEARSFFNENEEIVIVAKDAVYDALDDALANKSEDGTFSESDSAVLEEKIAAYHEALKNFWNKINERKQVGVENEDEAIMRGIESELSNGQVRLQYCENSYHQIIESGMEIALDEDMSDRLNQFARSMEYMDGTLKALVKMKDEIKGKLGASEQVSGADIAAMNERLDKLSINLQYLENFGIAISKKIEAKSKEQLDLLDRLAKLQARLEEKKDKGKFASEKIQTLIGSVINKILKLRTGVSRGAKLHDSEIAGLEDLAQNQILAPEGKNDVYAERMELFYKLRPRLQKEKNEIDEMSDQMIWVGKKEKTSPAKMRELFAKTGKKMGEAIGLNGLLLGAVSLETNPPIDEVKDQIKEYEEVLPEARKLFNKLTPEIKLMKINDLRPKLLWAEGDMAKKKLNVEQRAMLEGWKSILKSGDVTLEELDEIAVMLDAKIIEPLKGLLQKESVATRDKYVVAMHEREAEKKFEREGKEMEEPVETTFVPSKKETKKRAENEKEFLGEELGGEAPTRAEKAVLRKGVKEMLAESGVIDIDPEQIMDLLSEDEMRMLVFNVRKDVIEKSDKNRDAFYHVLRDALNENIFKELKKEERDRMLESVSAQTYAILRDAVKAEAECQIAKALSGEASKLAKAGKIGAGLAANVALAAGIGIGAAAIIGSGGAAAVVAGFSIPIVREVNKRLQKTEVFQKAKEKVKSFWGNTVGKLFKKEKPPVDEEQILKEVTEQIASKEKLAVILSNQIRENSSQDIIEQINFFAEQKNEAMRKPSPEAVLKFETALDGVSKEFFQKALNYVSMQEDYKNLPDDELARLAMTMTLTIGQNQRGEVAVAAQLAELEKNAKSPEERNWFVDKAEKFFKVRSAGIGAAVFGGGIAFAVAETSSAGRVISGAIAGAGLGMMIEKKFRTNEKEKMIKIIDKLISESEKKLKGKEAGALTEAELNEAKNNSAYISAQIDSGLFEDDAVLKNRAQNFVVRINRMALETMEKPYLDIEDLLKDVSVRSRELEKQTKKNIDRVKNISKDKKILAYMAVGAVVGGAFGYFGRDILRNVFRVAGAEAHDIKESIGVAAGKIRSAVGTETGQLEDWMKTRTDTFKSAVHDLTEGKALHEAAPAPAASLHAIPPETPLRAVPPETPLRAVPPETPLHPVPPETPLKPIHEFAGAGPHKAGVREALESAERKISEHGPAVSAVRSVGGKPIEVYEVYSASIKDIKHPQPVYFTREENIELQRFVQEKAIGPKYFEFVERAHERGQVYEDANGRQYHADELDFTPEKKIVNPYDLDEPKAGKGGKIEEPASPRAQKIENPYDNDVKFEEDLEKVRAHPLSRADRNFLREFDQAMKKPDAVSEAEYDKMIDLYKKMGKGTAAEYMSLINQGKPAEAEKYFDEAVSVLERDVYVGPVETGSESQFTGLAEGSHAHESVEIKPLRFEHAGRDIKTPEPVETPVKDLAPKRQAHIDEPSHKDSGQSKSSGANTAEAERARILKEIEERKQAEVEAEQEEGETENPEVEKIVAQRERAMVSQLESQKAKSAYGWLAEQAQNKNLGNADSTAVKGLKDDFVKDMVGDRKIEPSLLRKITALQKQIGQ